MNKNVGELLKELREKKHLSQNQLARKLHISRSVIAKYETGEREPSFNTLIILSKFFKIPITDLIPIYEDSIKSKNTKDVLNFLLKQNKTFRIIVITLIAILLMITATALVYINILNHVSTKVYKITTPKNNILIRDGLLVKTKDKIYLSLVNSIENEEIEKLSFYYLDEKEKVYIIETSEINNLKFYAYLNNNEYFDSNNYKKFFKNSYLEIYYKDNTSETIKLTYEFDYTNNNLESDIEEITTDKVSLDEKTEPSKDTYAFRNIQTSELYDIAKPFMEDNNLETFNVKLDGINYEISIINNLLSICYKQYKFVYLIIDKNENLTLSKTTNNYEELYSYNITKDTCKGIKCSQANEDIKSIKNLIEKLKK